mgnify:CR=1 FL=1
MDFASRITRLPRPFDPERGQEARDHMGLPPGPLSDLFAGAGGCSPYLKGLMEKERDWLLPGLDDPEGAVAQVLGDLTAVPPDQIGSALRQAKRRVALMTGLADLAGVWPLETVTGTLSDLADRATDLAFKAALVPEIKRKKLPGATEDDLETAAGWVAFAMGKGGARELNYSSDIDLICLFDETRYDRDDFQEARSSLVRATRKMAATLSDLTGEGYVFRTDLRLRPDPAVTPVCMAMAAAETYYESLGRTWERAAWIKARPGAGDLAAGARFQESLRPFVWRKHLDFAAIQDAHDMRLRIREHKGLHGAITLPGHDMKLGRGGIREIEFFTQTRQLIAGGRDPDLRLRDTVGGLKVLAEKGWVPGDVAETLTGHYRFHREVEHRLQMVGDAQTHKLPNDPDGVARIAAFMGRDRAELEAELMDRLTEVHRLTEGFFAPDDSGPMPEEEAVQFDSEIMARWPSYSALRSERATAIFNRLKPEILGRLARTAKPDEALVAFDGFLAGLPAGVQLFSLFEANPQLIDLLVDIVGTAPELARHLSRNAQVFDAVIGGAFFAEWPGKDSLVTDAAEVMGAEDDYERKLDALRRWSKEWHFRVGVHHLRGLIDAREAGRQYADLAGACLCALWPEVVAHFAAKHGTPPGRGAVVLGMGSLGAKRLNAQSDLDLIVIYDPEDVESSDGRRPLPSRSYYARLTQALVTAATAPMAEGRLYEVDMRLRPSGNQGPVATSWQSFRSYQQEQAWVWEHLALTRARVVAGDAGLGADVEAFRCTLLAEKGETDAVLSETAKMRARIAAAKSPSSLWDAKIGPGRLQDIELIAQAGALLCGTGERGVLRGLKAAVRCGLVAEDAGKVLRDAYRLFWSLQAATKLLNLDRLEPDTLGEGGTAFLLRETGADDLRDLGARVNTMAARAAEVIDQILPDVTEDA